MSIGRSRTRPKIVWRHEREHTDIYSSCRLIVRKNGAEIYNRTALDNTLIYSGVIDMPAGHGHMTLEFSVSAWLVNSLRSSDGESPAPVTTAPGWLPLPCSHTG